MANSKEMQKLEGVKSKKLLYTPVPIVREKELLLVRECADHLGPFGLTLWVVSMSMPKNCDTGFPHGMLDNFFFICVSQFLDIHCRLDFVYDQEFLFHILLLNTQKFLFTVSASIDFVYDQEFLFCILFLFTVQA